MTPERVQAWLDAYVEAWRTYDPDQIGALFADDASYAFHPWGEPIRGVEAIVSGWLQEPDPPDSWEASYRPLLMEGNRAVATGQTRYADGQVFGNIWVLSFDPAGRCTEFVEWYMAEPID